MKLNKLFTDKLIKQINNGEVMLDILTPDLYQIVEVSKDSEDVCLYYDDCTDPFVFALDSKFEEITPGIVEVEEEYEGLVKLDFYKTEQVEFEFAEEEAEFLYVVHFQYPTSNYPHKGIWRKIGVLEEDNNYLKGLDLNEERKFKCFSKGKITSEIWKASKY